MSIRHRIQIIFNPNAGTGSAPKRMKDIQRLCEGHGLDFTISRTEKKGHAEELSRTASERGYNVVAAAGGDGTVNEVINGLMHAMVHGKAAPRLAVLPTGRRNLFALGVGIGTDLRKGVALLAAGATTPIDVGFVRGGDFPGGRYFGNAVGIGFDTIAAIEGARITGSYGRLASFAGILRNLIHFPEAPYVDIIHDTGTIGIRSHQLSIMNGPRMGGSLSMNPDADNRDGYLDLCAAGELARGSTLHLIAHSLWGNLAGSRHITGSRSVSFQIRARDGGLTALADGETISVNGSELLIECLASRLQVIQGTLRAST